MKIKKFSTNSVVGVLGSAGLLSLLAIGLACPVSSAKEAYAATDCGMRGNADSGNFNVTGACPGILTTSTLKESKVTVKIPDDMKTVSLDLDASRVAENPMAAHNYTYGKVNVTTENAGAYRVYLTATSKGINGSTTDSNSMILTSGTDTSSIAPVAGEGKVVSAMANEWGYYSFVGAIGNTNLIDNNTIFKAMPTTRSSEPIYGEYNLTANTSKDINIALGAGIDSTLNPGTYGVNVTVSVVAEPGEVPVVPAGTTMQDFAAGTYCENMSTNQTAYLKDSRDSKYYWVTKMADGNCWMSQNLDTDVAVAGSWTNNGTAVNGFTATGEAYVAAEGAPTTTVQAAKGNGSNKPIQVYDISKLSEQPNMFTKIDSTNTDIVASVNGWGTPDAMKSGYSVLYPDANNGGTKFLTTDANLAGASPTAIDTMPDAVSNPSQVTTMSWDEGKYVYNTPTATTSCGSRSGGIKDCAVIPSANNGRAATDADAAIDRAFVDVSATNADGEGYVASKDPDFTAKKTFIGKDNTTVCAKKIKNAVAPVVYDGNGNAAFAAGGAGDGVDTVDSSVTATAEDYNLGGNCAMYDAHYLIGNYYQWNAATVSSGANIINTNAVSSICPKGWTLPLSGEGNNGESGSFYNLLVKYGVQSQLDGTGIDGLTYNISLAPLWWARSGLADPHDGTLRLSGVDSYARSRSAISADMRYAYRLDFDTSVVNPSNNGNRHYGFSLRCLHRP